MRQFLDELKPELSTVNELIMQRMRSQVPLVEEIGEYLVAAGGKRLRPILVLLSGFSCNYRDQSLYELAAVIEFLHTATLLHDDVIDVSELRRGRPTANANWGNASSILVGDFLYSRAFQMLVSLGDIKIMDILSNATNLIAEGEVLQLTKAGDPATSEAEYLSVIEYKTATLFAAAAQTGAVLAGADHAHEQALRRYGLNMGMAFQLMDDVLDYRGDAASLGKNVGDDLAEGKPTLPLIETMRCADTAARELVQQAIIEKSSEQLPAIVVAVEGSGALDFTVRRAEDYAKLARKALIELPNSAVKAQLDTLSEVAVRRNA
ncbi:MAG: polyprenyl synthetase family protein [Pseudomonadales bacterium]